MSHFVETLKRVLAENDRRQIRLSEGSGLSPSHVSHIINGKQLTVDPDVVFQLAKAAAKNKNQQAEIIRAHLLDQIPDSPAGDMIDVRIILSTGSEMKDAPARRRTALPPQLEQALERIAETCVHDKNMRDLVLNFAKYTGPAT